VEIVTSIHGERGGKGREGKVGRDLQRSSSPTARTIQGHQKLEHVIKGIVQMPLKHCQAWGIRHLSGKPLPVSDHPHGKEMLP